MKAFFDQINLHQATMTPITVMPGVIVAYTVSPWNSAQTCELKKDNKCITLADEASQYNSNATSIPNSIAETNTTQLPLMRMMKTCLLVKSRRNLFVQ
jgi:hypothetical protein